MYVALGSVEIHRLLSKAEQAWIMAEKLVSVLSERMAIRRKSFRLQKKFSTKCRQPYITSSISSGSLRCGRCEMQINAPRSFTSSMIQLASKALSASKASKESPRISGSTPIVS